ncbi:MAG: hypothetical protein MZV65_28160 [Chromatiales bacterium]|nr:hypothetical protein [Chromatiales bacterium]
MTAFSGSRMAQSIFKLIPHPRQFVVGAMSLMILIGVALPLMLGIRFRLHHAPALLADGPLSLWTVLLWGALAILPFLLAISLAIRTSPPRLAHLFAIVIGALLLRTVYLIAVDDVFVSDYRIMWDFTQSVLNGDRLLRAEQLQEIRTIPFLLPVSALAGGSALGFKIGNLLFRY